jgi:hypothetical protein
MTGCFLACPTPRCAGGGFDPEEEEEEEEEEEAALDVDGDDDDSDDSDVDVDASREPRRDDDEDDDDTAVSASASRGLRASSSSRDDHRAGSRTAAATVLGAAGGPTGARRRRRRRGRLGAPLAEEAGDNLVAEDPLMPEATTRGVRAGLERGATAEAATARVARAGRKARGAGIAGVGFAADAVASAADAIARSDPRPSARGAAAPSGMRCLPEEAPRGGSEGAARVPRASGPGDATREALETGAAAFEPRAESRPRERSSDARHERGAKGGETYPGEAGGRRGFAHAGVSSAAANASNARRTRTTNDPSRRRSFIVRVVAPRAGRMRSPATPASGSALFHDVERALVGVDAERAKALVSRAACDALAEVRAPRRTNAGGVRSPL